MSIMGIKMPLLCLSRGVIRADSAFGRFASDVPAMMLNRIGIINISTCCVSTNFHGVRRRANPPLAVIAVL
jgi:hypothetical protein